LDWARGEAKLFSSKRLQDGEMFVFLRHENPPSLSMMLKCAGRFIFIPMTNRIPFQKLYINSLEFVNLLKSRGLTVPNPVAIWEAHGWQQGPLWQQVDRVVVE